jgi:nitric oxide reductase NorD protein
VLRRIKTATKHLSHKETERWIIHAFDLFESQGMDSFFRFLSRIDEEALNRFKMQEGLHLQTVNSLLETYLHGISGKELKITAGDESYTDTDTIFLPPVINRFQEPEYNFLLYKLMAVFHWARIVKGSLLLDDSTLRLFLNNAYSKDSDIAELFLFFPEQALAKDLYILLDSFRIREFLRKELRGLMREADVIREKLFSERPVPRTLSEKAAFAEGLYQYFLVGHNKEDIPDPLKKVIPLIQEIKEADEPRQPLCVLSEYYQKIAQL